MEVCGNEKKKGRPTNETYTGLVFPVSMVRNKKLAICIFCLKSVVAGSIKPNKLKWHLGIYRRAPGLFSTKPQ